MILSKHKFPINLIYINQIYKFTIKININITDFIIALLIF